jgi:hypothetical protein
MRILNLGIFYLLNLLFLISGCGNKSQTDQENNMGVLPITDGGEVAPGSEHPGVNPRHPDLKTYGTINSGYYSILRATSFTFSSDQSFFGGTAKDDSLLLSFKRMDSSGLNWIDIYVIPKVSGTLTFNCKIRDDGNLAYGIKYDLGTLFIRSNNSPIKYRSFNFSNCVEGSQLNTPMIVSPWVNCSNWDILDGLLNICLTSNASGTVIKNYSESTGQVSSVVSEIKWNDFSISFSQSLFVRTKKGTWGIRPANQSLNMNLYFIDSNTNVGNWSPLPSNDYPDLTNNYQVTLTAETDDDRNLYIIARKEKVIRIYLLDVESF